jgi:hypothetical protein
MKRLGYKMYLRKSGFHGSLQFEVKQECFNVLI